MALEGLETSQNIQIILTLLLILLVILLVILSGEFLTSTVFDSSFSCFCLVLSIPHQAVLMKQKSTLAMSPEYVVLEQNSSLLSL
jgi:hypothetical protein